MGTPRYPLYQRRRYTVEEEEEEEEEFIRMLKATLQLTGGTGDEKGAETAEDTVIHGTLHR